MIEFEYTENEIFAIYSTDQENKWVYEKLERGSNYAFNKAFYFNFEHLVTTREIWEKEYEKLKESDEYGLDGEVYPSIKFHFAKLDGDYFKVNRGILSENFDVYLTKDYVFDIDYFVFQDVSFFHSIYDLISEDTYIGGNHPNAIIIEFLHSIVPSLPTQHEIKLYRRARVASIIREHFATTKDAEQKFEKYRNKKISKKGSNLLKTFKDAEIEKFETVLNKMKRMLDDENDYSEHQWQDEILQIILLLYPKYISVFKSVPIKASIAGNIKEREIDLLLVDSNGNVDVIEIKKPFEKAIMTNREYRNNFIPLKELSGSVMQLEKYIYYLNRWSEKGEAELTVKYKEQLPIDFDLKITNPNGLIIMGRENNLSAEQKRDFEVVKRKYKNVADIITYDNLLDRLRYTIERLKSI